MWDGFLEPVLNGGRVMNVGLRDPGTIINKVQSILPLIGGERAILRRIDEAVPPQYLSGLMVESALNYYCRYRRMPYGSVLCAVSLSVVSTKKLGGKKD